MHDYLTEAGYTDVLDDPRRIFNVDETAIYLHPKKGRVPPKKGSSNVYNVTAGSEKECLTVLLGGNASNDLMPPMVLYHYLRTPFAVTDSTLRNGFVIGQSRSGWMTVDSFYEYITNHFLPWLIDSGIPRPVMLFLDGHASHMSLQLSLFCRDNQIILVALLPNATHMLQPMDVGVFKSLKVNWKLGRQSWNANHLGQVFQKQDFGDCLRAALDTMKGNVDLFKSAFKATGTLTSYKLYL